MSTTPLARAELQDADLDIARTRASRTRRAPAETQSRRVRQHEHEAIRMKAVSMNYGIRVSCGMYPFLVRPYSPYIRTRNADLHDVIGGLERLCTHAEVRQARQHGTCEGCFAGWDAAPFECRLTPWEYGSSR